MQKMLYRNGRTIKKICPGTNRSRLHSHYDTAERLEVTEKFLTEALACYKQKYGRCITVDNYVIFFEPSLSVLEIK